MIIDVIKNFVYQDCWDLWVDGVLEIEGESFTVVDSVRAALKGSNAFIGTEIQDVANGILESRGNEKDREVTRNRAG